MLLKAPESTLNITPSSHGEYFLKKTNKFTGEITKYRQENLITDAWGAFLLTHGGIPSNGNHKTQRILWLSTDTEEPYADLPSNVGADTFETYGMSYFTTTQGAEEFRFGRDLAEYTAEGINKNGWLSNNTPPFPVPFVHSSNSGSSVVCSGMMDTAAPADQLRTYVHEGDGYINAKAKATFFGETGYTGSSQINSIRVGFKIHPYGSNNKYQGYNILSWAKLDTPIPLTSGDVVSVEWEATACYTGAPQVTVGSDVRRTASVSSASTQLLEGQYDYGVDPSGPPSSTVNVDATVSVQSALTATSSGMLSTNSSQSKRELNTLFSNYETIRDGYLTAAVTGYSPSATSQVERRFLLTFDDPNLPAWAAAGYATPASNRELVVHTVSGITSPMVTATGTATTLSTLGSLGTGMHKYGTEITFTPPVALNPGTRKRYVVEAALRISWPVTRTPLDTAALPTEVKTALGIA